MNNINNDEIKQIGLYIHIPFCMHKCDYCDFVSFAKKDEYIEPYIQQVIKEIKQEKLEQYRITTIYIGGGTPSFIPSKYIKKILDLVDKRYAKEITIEVNPGTVDKVKLQDYYNLGINRLSMGLQSTDNNILKEISRIHTYEQFLDTYNLAKNVGFNNINIDLMIGLPKQKIEGLNNSLEKIISLEPKHISVYSLILEEGTVLENKINNGILQLPNEETEREMYWLVKSKLEDAGYIHYEISNFSKPGFEAKHNMACWEQEEYIGIGLAAHSYLNKTRYSNTEDLKSYLNNIKENRIIHEMQDTLSQEKEYMILGLRKIEGVDIQKFKNKFVENPIYIYRESLDKLFRNKLIEIDANYIRLTKRGIDLANLVWEEFI